MRWRLTDEELEDVRERLWYSGFDPDQYSEDELEEIADSLCGVDCEDDRLDAYEAKWGML